MNFLQNKKFSLKKQYQIISEIDYFLQKDYTIIEIVEILNDEQFYRKLKKHLQKGKSIEEYFEKQLFSKELIMILEISQRTSTLKSGINSSKKYLQEKIKFSSDFLEQLKYPIILLTLLIISCLFISYFLVPQFLLIYQSFQMEFAGFIKYLYYLIKYSPFVIIVLLMIIISIYQFSNEASKERIKNIYRFVLFKKTYQQYYHYIFTSNVVNLISLNITLEESFAILSEYATDSYLRRESKRIQEEIHRGTAFSDTLSTYYYGSLRRMLLKGQQKELLKEYLNDYYHYMSSQKKQAQKNILLIIQPIIYLVFGVIIIGLYLMIFIPMFELMETF